MCGIYGVWRFDGQPVDLNKLQQATTTLRHRGPDDEGYLLAETATGSALLCGGDNTDARLNLPSVTSAPAGRHDLALAFRRLAILDLSPAGHQPMPSADGRCWIVFNGEVYNYIELRQELAGLGHRFVSGSDTEVILAAYQQWGIDCLHRFNGMWGLAIWDTDRRELFLARDRFGVKPLYYVHEPGVFAFASEIKALVGRHGIEFAPNSWAIYDYVVSGALPNPQLERTFFDGVAALPPGCWLRVGGDGVLVKERYYTLPMIDGTNAITHNPDQVVEEFGALFTDAVRLRLRADVPIGTCLSGGVDSSSIVCVVNRLMREGGVAAEQIGEHQKTFSAVYATEGRYNESAFIEIALKATGAERNFTYPTVERLADDMERLVWHQEEPFGSTSIFAQWCVMQKAREAGVTVLLDGQGADEALAGYRPYAPFLADLLSQFQVRRFSRELGRIAANTGWSRLDWLKRALIWQLPASWRKSVVRSAKTQPPGRSLLNPGFAAACADRPSSPSSFARQTFSQHLHSQVFEDSLPHLLRYEDRNSMAFSIEARVPFVDYRMMEFSFNQAADLRIRDGWTKWVLRRAMQKNVPAEILWRKDKIGFETPQQEWLHTLVALSPDLFGSQAFSAAYLNCADVRQRMPQLLGESVTNQSLLWRLINLEMWLRVWRRQSSNPDRN
jgi:asparagine synthase (glutamine-hydrolysing)